MNRHALTEKYLPGRESALLGNVILVPVKEDALRATIHTLATEHNLPFVTMMATDERHFHKCFRIHYIFGVPNEKKATFIAPVLDVTGDSFPSIAQEYAWALIYEREVHTMFGLTPEGHPDPRSTVLYEENFPANTYPLRKDFAWDTNVPDTKAGEYQFNVIEGEGIYEVPVGPVHAGIIEPGHFRFSMAGEDIVSLEPRLGWVHKGVEKLFENLPAEKHLTLAEHVSGDNSFSHALAYSQAIETVTNTTIPARAAHLRSIFGELERLTTHIFDIGNIPGNGTGFSFATSNGFRMSEMLRQMNEKLTGHRFLRGVAVPGGVTKDIKSEHVTELKDFLAKLHWDLKEMVDVIVHSAVLLNRTRTAGALSQQAAHDLGAVGIGARASGIARDVRRDYPYAAYGTHTPDIALEEGGDVEARLNVRIKEAFITIELLKELLESLPKGDITTNPNKLPVEGMAVSLVESPRGELAYTVVIEKAAITRVKVRDASFMNWQLFPHLATRDIIPDFPLINKSFNLSYTGNDL